MAESVKLENDYMSVVVEPDAGARISSWQLKKFRVVLTAEEIAALTGVTLVDE